MMIDVMALGLAIQTAQKQNLPIKSIDFDASGSFRIMCEVSAVDWAVAELSELAHRHGFNTRAEFIQARAILEAELQRKSETQTGAIIIVGGL